MAGHICKYEGCDQPGTAGKFGHTYCETHNEIVKAEKEREKELRATAPPEQTDEPAPRRSRSLGGQRGSLREQIKDAVMMTAAVAAVKDPRIFVAIEATVDEFAIAWDNVAKQSPAARRYIKAMLTGGVWISAFGATLAMTVTVLACTEKLPENFAALGYFFTTKAGLTLVPVGAATMNGGEQVDVTDDVA